MSARIAGSMVLAAAIGAGADEALDAEGRGRLTEMSLEELGSVEVTTASKAPEQVWRTAAAISVITREDIRRSGATTLAELLRMAPGVEVARIDNTHWAVGVRGFGDQFSKSVLVLIDGRSVYTPLFAGVLWAVQDTLLEDVERIEVIRGPGGTIWGANAVNGVINIITRRARDTHGPLATAAAGSVDHGLAGFRYGGGNGRGFDYRVYGKGFLRGTQFHQDEADFDEWRMGQGGFQTSWAGAAGGSFTLQGDAYFGRVGQSVSLASFTPPSQATVHDPLDVSGGNLLAQWARQSSGGGRLQVLAYYDRTRLEGPQLVETRNTFDVDFIHHLRAYGRHSLTWGLGARVSPGAFTPTVATLDFTPHRHTNSVYTAFVQDEINAVTDRLRLTVGSKVEHNDYTGFEVQPGARLLWTIGPHQSAWAAVSRAVRTPSRIERDFRLNALLAPSPLTYLQIDGSSEFDSERQVAYEAGYRVLAGPRVYVDVAAFHNVYDGLAAFGAASLTIDVVPVPPHATLHFPFANGVRGTTTGFEVAPEWKPTDWWQVKLAYSHLRFDLENEPGNTDTGSADTFEGSSPRHLFTAESRMDLGHGLELDLAYRHVSDLPARSVDGYGTLNARLGWGLARGLELSLIGQNLLQPRHAEFGHDPPPIVRIRRGVTARIAWQP
jgi:iron complex outermembrane receptor protein